MLTAFAVVATAFIGSAQAQDKSPDKITLRYGQIANSARSVSSLSLVIAQRMGFLAKEGISLDVIGLPGVQHQIEELDKGNVDVSFTATPYLIQAVLNGSDAVGVIAGAGNTIYSLIAKPEIKSFDALRGKTIAMSLSVDTISIATRLLLAKHGLNASDYRVKELVSTPRRAECLTKGECDAVPMGQPDDIVFGSKGYSKLGDSFEVIPVLQFSVIAARRAWAAQHKDVLVRLARAFGESYKFMRNPATRDEMVALFTETTGAPADVARATLAFYFEPDRGVMPKQAEISMAGLTKVIELLGQSGALQAPLPPAEKFVDLQYLQAAGLQ
jgi:ABC-type nitrate/sulfonate/bicarbonate transport system substrate-binding protein